MRPAKAILSAVFMLFLAWSLTEIQGPLVGWAAKKYYPPGFTPPSDSDFGSEGAEAKPAQSPAQAPRIVYPVGPSLRRQVIIKTVPVPSLAAPPDPLDMLLQEHRLYDALRLVDSRIRKSPGNLSLHLIRAKVLREEGRFEQSDAEYRNVIGKSRSGKIRAEAWSGLGLLKLSHAQHMERLGDTKGSDALLKEAGAHFHKALQLNGRFSEAWTGLGQLALSQNKLKEAENALRTASRYAPNKPIVLLSQSQLLMAQGKPADALPLLYKAKRQAPMEPQVDLLLGQISLALEKLDDAIIHFKRVLELEPEHPEALRSLSVAYEKKMKPEDAEFTLVKAISLNPGDVGAAKSLLRLYDSRGENERSLLFLRTLLKQQPGQKFYQEAVLERLIKAGRWTEAYDEGAAYVEVLPDTAEATTPVDVSLASLFTQAAHHQGRGLINRREMLERPAPKKVAALWRRQLHANPVDLAARLNLLLLDPGTTLPTLPQVFVPKSEELPAALKIAFLQGNRDARAMALQGLLQSAASKPEVLIATAEELLNLCDYAGARILAEAATKVSAGYAQAKALLDRIAAAENAASQQLKVLRMMPANMPASHWEKVAEEALRLSTGNSTVHAVVAESLLRRKNAEFALGQQRLAAQYAATPKERQQWLKKAAKTEREIIRTTGKMLYSTYAL